MSLIPVILSHARRILSTVIGTDATVNTINSNTSGVATTVGTIDTNTQPSAIATDVQTGMTSQGYSGTRAGKLDNLDTSISSRSSAITTRPLVSVSSLNLNSPPSITLVNVSGPGVLHHLDFVQQGIHGGAIVTVTIDGNTVSSWGVGMEFSQTNSPWGSNWASGGTVLKFFTAGGYWLPLSYNLASSPSFPFFTLSPSITGTFSAPMGDLNMEFRSSLVISIQGTSSNGYQSCSLWANCLYSN